MSEEQHARVFWSGGSQAVRLPKSFRVEGDEVLIRKRGKAIIIEPIPADEWGDFWERLQPGADIKRWKTGPAERRKPL
jgi:antitoxin VapB